MKRHRFRTYKDETTSFWKTHVPKRGTLVPDRAEMQKCRGGGWEKEEEKTVDLHLLAAPILLKLDGAPLELMFYSN